MKAVANEEGILTFGTVIKLCLALGVGAGVLVLPFMLFNYRAELGVIETISLIVLVPIANGLFMLFYAFAGFWLYRYFGKRHRFGLQTLMFVKHDGSAIKGARLD